MNLTWLVIWDFVLPSRGRPWPWSLAQFRWTRNGINLLSTRARTRTDYGLVRFQYFRVKRNTRRIFRASRLGYIMFRNVFFLSCSKVCRSGKLLHRWKENVCSNIILTHKLMKWVTHVVATGTLSLPIDDEFLSFFHLISTYCYTSCFKRVISKYLAMYLISC